MFFLVLLVPLVLMVAIKLLAQPSPRPRSNWDYLQYRKVEYLLSPTELEFQSALALACPDHLYICPKVRVGDVLEPKPNTIRTRQKIDRKHFDWVLIDADSARIVAAIELDDRSHDLPHRRDRDLLLNDACSKAAFPLIRFPAASKYDHTEIRSTLGKVQRTD